jgi:hypothetical protein
MKQTQHYIDPKKTQQQTKKTHTHIYIRANSNKQKYKARKLKTRDMPTSSLSIRDHLVYRLEYVLPSKFLIGLALNLLKLLDILDFLFFPSLQSIIHSVI